MKEIYAIVTPIGKGTVQYGEIMPGDGRKKKYHCWWNGWMFGGEGDTIEGASKYLREFMKHRLTLELHHLKAEVTELRMLLDWF